MQCQFTFELSHVKNFLALEVAKFKEDSTFVNEERYSSYTLVNSVQKVVSENRRSLIIGTTPQTAY